MPNLNRLIRQLFPEAQQCQAESLSGGVSADSFVLRFAVHGNEQAWVLRCPKADNAQRCVRNESIILRAVAATGLSVPLPELDQPLAELLTRPGYLYRWLPGTANYQANFNAERVEVMANQLAKIHQTPLSSELRLAVPGIATVLDGWLKTPPENADAALLETDIRTALESVWPQLRQAKPALLHGDFWPGNLLWQGSELSAVVDWEDACLGSPLFDLAIVRLDLTWVCNAETAERFTEAYQRQSGADLTSLPHWDLLAALRPCQQLSQWAASWPELGRSDITVAAMRAKQNEFARKALATQ